VADSFISSVSKNILVINWPFVCFDFKIVNLLNHSGWFIKYTGLEFKVYQQLYVQNTVNSSYIVTTEGNQASLFF